MSEQLSGRLVDRATRIDEPAKIEQLIEAEVHTLRTELVEDLSQLRDKLPDC